MKKELLHVAIIMDGNGRWATSQGLKRTDGHKEGGKTLEKLALHAKKLGIKYLSVYAFSTDNFKRSEEEVNYLMDLIIYYFNHKLKKVCEEGIKVVFSGRKENLRKDVLEAMQSIIESTKNNNECVLNICLNYGGQEEIVDASLKIYEDLKQGKLKKEELNREAFAKYLYQDLPPIDLLIRTGKEKRLSNFMLYQMFYAEIYFSDVYFPAFDEKAFDEAIAFFYNRNRRFGNVKNNN